MRILSVLGLESDLDLLALDDKLGRLLQDNELAPRRRPRWPTYAQAVKGRGSDGKPRER